MGVVVRCGHRDDALRLHVHLVDEARVVRQERVDVSRDLERTDRLVRGEGSEVPHERRGAIRVQRCRGGCSVAWDRIARGRIVLDALREGVGDHHVVHGCRVVGDSSQGGAEVPDHGGAGPRGPGHTVCGDACGDLAVDSAFDGPLLHAELGTHERPTVTRGEWALTGPWFSSCVSCAGDVVVGFPVSHGVALHVAIVCGDSICRDLIAVVCATVVGVSLFDAGQQVHHARRRLHVVALCLRPDDVDRINTAGNVGRIVEELDLGVSARRARTACCSLLRGPVSLPPVIVRVEGSRVRVVIAEVNVAVLDVEVRLERGHVAQLDLFRGLHVRHLRVRAAVLLVLVSQVFAER